MPHIEETCDIVVIGAGHAGCEAALAAARLGFETVLFTVSIESIAMMPCNPNIGGTSKGHLVREVDALGGEMGRNIDATFIQSRMLNMSKGPAVHSLRAQADKQAYTRRMRRVLEDTPGLRLRQAEVARIDVDGDGHVCAVRTTSGAVWHCRAAVLCSGTYLKARCIYGDVSEETGPNGLRSAGALSGALRELGIRLVRFKTGTPARIDGRTADLSRMEEQPGDPSVVPFSFETDPASVQKPQVSCYLTYTNELYLSGLSSSLPEDVQQAMIHTIPGLEHAHIVRNAYAIEYDCLAPGQLSASLELRAVPGLFCAGQFNGSSGYEEAAAQGLIAGVNAARSLQGKEPVVLSRSQAYIGVLIDDLVTKENREPYRMMTARAEYRLLLRQDNADLRLTRIGYEIGLISQERYEALLQKEAAIEAEEKRLEETFVGTSDALEAVLADRGSTPLKSGISLAELLRRPELSYADLAAADPGRPNLPADVCEQVEISIKYEGYLRRQQAQVERFEHMEKRRLPQDTPYEEIKGLRIEAAQKLAQFRPENLGQASRLPGVSPADVSVLLIWLEQHRRREE